MLEEIQEEIGKFNKLQTELGEYGASDTEPDYVFQDCLIQALKGRSTSDIPTSASDWHLFKRPGVGAAVKQLSGKAKRICSLILKTTLAEQDTVKAYIKDYCWRIKE